MQNNQNGDIQDMNEDDIELGDQSHWKFNLKGEDENGTNFFTLSNKRHPNRFLYHTERSGYDVASCEGDPGPRGYLYLEKLEMPQQDLDLSQGIWTIEVKNMPG